MPPRGTNPDIIRIIEGIRGRVTVEMELIIRFDYGHIVPWVRKRDGALEAIAGPDALHLANTGQNTGPQSHDGGEFEVAKRPACAFCFDLVCLSRAAARLCATMSALAQTRRYWTRWAKQFKGKGKWRDAILRSLIVLKGLTYAPSGGIVAAATTSLPEEIGGVRNWDYRLLLVA